MLNYFYSLHFMLQHETRNSCGNHNDYDLAAVIVHHGSGYAVYVQVYTGHV